MENFDFNKIEKYLRNGGDASVIANAFADKLNAVINTMKAENDLTNAAEKVSLAWNDYINIYFGINKLPDGTMLEDWYMEADEVGKLIDTVIKLFPVAKKYADMIDNASRWTEKIINETKNTIKNPPSDNFENTLKSFYKKYGI